MANFKRRSKPKHGKKFEHWKRFKAPGIYKGGKRSSVLINVRARLRDESTS